MKQSFSIIKDIELDRINLKISTAISKIVYQRSKVKSCIPIGIFQQKEDISRLETMTKQVQTCVFFDVAYQILVATSQRTHGYINQEKQDMTRQVLTQNAQNFLDFFLIYSAIYQWIQSKGTWVYFYVKQFMSRLETISLKHL